MPSERPLDGVSFKVNNQFQSDPVVEGIDRSLDAFEEAKKTTLRRPQESLSEEPYNQPEGPSAFVGIEDTLVGFAPWRAVGSYFIGYKSTRGFKPRAVYRIMRVVKIGFNMFQDVEVETDLNKLDGKLANKVRRYGAKGRCARVEGCERDLFDSRHQSKKERHVGAGTPPAGQARIRQLL